MTWRLPLSRHFIVALAIIAAGLGLRLFYMSEARVAVPLHADAAQYFRIAENVVRFGTFSTADPNNGIPVPDSYRAPGYPAVVAVALAASPDIGAAYRGMMWIQLGFGALAGGLIFLLARRWMSDSYAALAGTLVAVWPHLIAQEAYALTESLFCACLVFGVYVTVRAVESGRQLAYAGGGLCFAAATLINPVAFPIPLLAAALVAFVAAKSATAKPWTRIATFLVCACVLPFMWSVRDHQVAGLGGRSADSRLFENVLIGSEPDYFRYYADQTDTRGVAARERVQAALVQYGVDRRAAYASVAHRIGEAPLTYAAWALRKPQLLWMWSIAQGADDIFTYPMLTSPFETNSLYRVLAAVCHGLNNILAWSALGTSIVVVVRCFRTPRRSADPALPLVGLMFVYATVVYTILTPDARYANPFRPFEIVLGVTLLALAHRRFAALRAHTDQ